MYVNVSTSEYNSHIHQCYLFREPPSQTDIGCAILCEKLECFMSKTTAEGCVICDNCPTVRDPIPVVSPPVSMYKAGIVDSYHSYREGYIGQLLSF